MRQRDNRCATAARGIVRGESAGQSWLPLSRRQALRVFAATGGTIVGASALSACGAQAAPTIPAPPPSPGASATGPQTGTLAADVIMLIRHAEKPAGKAGPGGITADGATSAGSLTVTGWTRAGALVTLFAPSRGEPPGGLFRPTTVWAADPRGDEGQRPQQTVTPLAARLGTTVDSHFGKGQEADLATALTNGHGVALVAWQHEEIPAIVAHMGSVTPMTPTKWPGERFDIVWVFTRTGKGWAFSQVPQLLLAGDRSDVIS